MKYMKFNKILIIILSAMSFLLFGIGIGYYLFSGTDKKTNKIEYLPKSYYQNIVNNKCSLQKFNFKVVGKYDGENNIEVIGKADSTSNINTIDAEITLVKKEKFVSNLKFEFDYTTNTIWENVYVNNKLESRIRIGNDEEIPDISIFDTTKLLSFFNDIFQNEKFECNSNTCEYVMDGIEKRKFLSLINFITFDSYDILLEENIKPKIIANFDLDSDKIKSVEIFINDFNKMVFTYES